MQRHRRRDRERQTEEDTERHRDRRRDRDTDTERETETQRRRKTWMQGDPESETRSRRHRRTVRGRSRETSRDAAGTGASGLAAPARLAETHIPSWGFRWKPSSPTGALPHFELQLKTS